MKLLIHNRTKGQALIVVALALIGLLAVVALAVDGSMIYSDRRELQSAADNAAMTAAATVATSMDTGDINHQNFICTGNAIVTEAEIAALNAAISRAGTYGYEIDTDISDHNGVQIACFVKVEAGLVKRYLDVRVEIAHQSDTGFTRFIMPNGVTQTVEAVARVQPRRSLSMGNAIASLNTTCPGIDMGGNPTVYVNGGGIFSNSCLSFNGSADIWINVDYGGIGYVTSYTTSGNVHLTPADMVPEQSSELLPVVEIPTPDCLSLPNYTSTTVSGEVTINPGRYSAFNLGAHDHIKMNPGLYCLYGSLTANAGAFLEVNPASTGDEGVTIYMAAGGIRLNGNAMIILRSPAVAQPPAIKGMLIYAPPNNCSLIELSGTSGSSFRGTVYAPCSNIVITGTADLPFATELVGGTVSVQGNARIDITDDAFVNYTRPPLIELAK